MTEQAERDQQVGDVEAAEYERPAVEELETTDGPAVTAAGGSGPK